jgi:hypothetical protein
MTLGGCATPGAGRLSAMLADDLRQASKSSTHDGSRVALLAAMELQQKCFQPRERRILQREFAIGLISQNKRSELGSNSMSHVQLGDGQLSGHRVVQIIGFRALPQPCGERFGVRRVVAPRDRAFDHPSLCGDRDHSVPGRIPSEDAAHKTLGTTSAGSLVTTRWRRRTRGSNHNRARACSVNRDENARTRRYLKVSTLAKRTIGWGETDSVEHVISPIATLLILGVFAIILAVVVVRPADEPFTAMKPYRARTDSRRLYPRERWPTPPTMSRMNPTLCRSAPSAAAIARASLANRCTRRCGTYGVPNAIRHLRG